MDIDALVNLGTLELALGNVDSAKTLLERAAGLDPGCNWQLSDVYLKMGDLTSAKVLLERAVEAGEQRALPQLDEVRSQRRA